MNVFTDLQSLVADELQQTDELIHEKIISDIPLAKNIAEHIVSSGGKRVRPLVVLLSAMACDELNEKAISLAAIIELLHTATLLHDDVIDESTQRRGKPTANENWGNEASVLVGDLLYSRSFQLIASLKHTDITQVIADATSKIVEGEVLQLMHCHDTTTTQETYIEIVKRKTGMLFEVAALAGPILAGADEVVCEAMQTYGSHLGIAFQILDDALDYQGDAELIGKNLGDDLHEGKPTLPLIYVLKHGDNAQKKVIVDAIRNPEDASLTEVQKIIADTQAIVYCQELAQQMIIIAKQQLSVLKGSPAKQALADLADFVILRNY